jgi:hypothetical protein
MKKEAHRVVNKMLQSNIESHITILARQLEKGFPNPTEVEVIRSFLAALTDLRGDIGFPKDLDQRLSLAWMAFDTLRRDTRTYLEEHPEADQTVRMW